MQFKNSIIIIGLVTVINCGGGSNESATSPTLDLASGNYQCAAIRTNLGEIQIALDEVNAPITVANFLNYISESFYTNTIFHRVISNFVIQGGGYDAAFNKKPTNTAITNEADNGLLNTRGAIAMARTNDPNSATAQFFINTRNNTSLNFRSKTSRGWGYAVFAWVVSGMDVVDVIRNLSTGAAGPFPGDVPQSTVLIRAITIIPCSAVK